MVASPRPEGHEGREPAACAPPSAPSSPPQDASRDAPAAFSPPAAAPTAAGSQASVSDVEPKPTSPSPAADATHDDAAASAAVAAAASSKPDPFRVVFQPGDPHNPKNWHPLRKWQILLVTLLPQVWANLISATYAPGMSYVSRDFHVSPAAARVVQAIYLYGFAVGPVLTAPLSEDLGRLPVLAVSCLAMGLFQLHCALSPNYASLLVARFLSGFFAAATFNSVGTIADLWIPDEQGWGVNSFGLAAEIGVVIPSIYSGFLVQRTQGWRWLFGVTGIGTGFLTALYVLTVPETHPGVLLSSRARRLRKKTGDDRYWSDHDRKREQRSRMDTVREVIIRPAHMLLTEPIVSAFAAFDGYNYSIIYLCVEATPLVYARHGFSMPVNSYGILAIGVGFILAYPTYAIPQAIVRRAKRQPPVGEVEPETLLVWGMFIAPLFPVSLLYVCCLIYAFACGVLVTPTSLADNFSFGPREKWKLTQHLADVALFFLGFFFFFALFVSTWSPTAYSWFAWTLQPSLPWIVSMLALALFGFCSHIIFIFVSDYTVAAYGHFSSSAVAGQSLAREIISGSAALIAEPMFNNLPSYEWAACVLAFIALPLAFIPMLLYKTGPWLRTHSPFAKQIARDMAEQAFHSPSSTLVS